jgi:hypothetical protein
VLGEEGSANVPHSPQRKGPDLPIAVVILTWSLFSRVSKALFSREKSELSQTQVGNETVSHGAFQRRSHFAPIIGRSAEARGVRLDKAPE